jgi:hypothetical protein
MVYRYPSSEVTPKQCVHSENIPPSKVRATLKSYTDDLPCNPSDTHSFFDKWNTYKLHLASAPTKFLKYNKDAHNQKKEKQKKAPPR